MAWSVTIHERGRSGAIRYAEGPLRSHDFPYEFCGGTAVVAIALPTLAEWPRALPWATGRRAEIIQRIVATVGRDRCPGCRAEVTDGWITFFEQGS